MPNLKNINVLVTAGSTREYIDDVRVMTNISSGALGAKIVEQLGEAGATIHFVHSRFGIKPNLTSCKTSVYNYHTWSYITFEDLYNRMKMLLLNKPIDVVIHSAAVSDFTFKRRENIKLSSNSSKDFINYMRDTITPTPKIIREIKEWNSNVFLVGFKFTVGKSENELIKITEKMKRETNCDLVIANDKKQMQDRRQHLAYFIQENYLPTTETSKELIAKRLISRLKEAMNNKRRNNERSIYSSSR